MCSCASSSSSHFWISLNTPLRHLGLIISVLKDFIFEHPFSPRFYTRSTEPIVFRDSIEPHTVSVSTFHAASIAHKHLTFIIFASTNVTNILPEICNVKVGVILIWALLTRRDHHAGFYYRRLFLVKDKELGKWVLAKRASGFLLNPLANAFEAEFMVAFVWTSSLFHVCFKTNSAATLDFIFFGCNLDFPFFWDGNIINSLFVYSNLIINTKHVLILESFRHNLFF